HRPASSALYPLSLHDALPISLGDRGGHPGLLGRVWGTGWAAVFIGLGIFAHASFAVRGEASGHLPPEFLRCFVGSAGLVKIGGRSEEHTSELQSRENLVCRLL